MIFKIKVNPETLDVILDDSGAVVNHIKKEDGFIEIEVSKPDPEFFNPYLNIPNMS